jgi:hypothetical protein
LIPVAKAGKCEIPEFHWTFGFRVICETACAWLLGGPERPMEDRLMSRGAQKFKQGDVTKAVKAVVKAGVPVGRVEIENGKIVVIAGNKPEEIPANENEWDSVLK